MVATTRLVLRNLVSNLRIITIHMYMFMVMLICCAKLRRILFRMLYVMQRALIRVSVTQGELMGTIVVQDTGIGFTDEEAKSVFSRFWRADAGRTRESGGLGIGLSVVKEIA